MGIVNVGKDLLEGSKLYLHVMDALGVPSYRKSALVVKIEIIDNSVENIVFSSAETAKCLNIRHFFWDSKIELHIPTGSSLSKYLFRLSLVEKELDSFPIIVAESLKPFSEILETLLTKGVERVETVIRLVWIAQMEESPSQRGGNTNPTLLPVRLRLGLLLVPGQLLFSQEVTIAVAGFLKKPTGINATII